MKGERIKVKNKKDLEEILKRKTGSNTKNCLLIDKNSLKIS